MLSVIIPSFNEEEMIEKTASTLAAILEENKIDYELIFVDDGSKDQTWQLIEAASNTNNNVRGISFSRNFGKEAAMMAGLAHMKGDCAAVIDCDLQHPPIKLVEMYKLWEKGAQVVEGIKTDRGEESAFHKFATKKFYFLLSNATGSDMSRMSDFKLMDKKVVDSILALPEDKHFLRALSSWVGFNAETVEYEVCERTAGSSKWNTVKLFKYAIDNISSFSTMPMQIVEIAMYAITLIALVFAIIQKNIVFIIISCCLGLAVFAYTKTIGYYAARSFDELQMRPKYIIEKTIR